MSEPAAAADAFDAAAASAADYTAGDAYADDAALMLLLQEGEETECYFVHLSDQGTVCFQIQGPGIDRLSELSIAVNRIMADVRQASSESTLFPKTSLTSLFY